MSLLAAYTKGVLAELDTNPPYTLFEDAASAMVSRNISEQQIWYIQEQAKSRWGAKRNTIQILPVTLREES